MSIINGFRQWLPKRRDSVMVPEGHEVVLLKPSSSPSFGRTKSGIWIADFGPQGHIEPGFKFVENVIRDDPKSSVIWILQKELLDYWTSDALRITEILKQFYRIRRFRVDQGWAGREMSSYWGMANSCLSDMFEAQPPIQQRCVADVAVFVDAGADVRAIMTLLSSIGIPAHLCAPEKEVFVEVHKPDKVIVGIPSLEMISPSDQTLYQLNLERDKLNHLTGAGAELAVIEKRELAYIKQVLQTITSPVKRPTKPLLSDLMSQSRLTRDAKIYRRFVEMFMCSNVGVRVSGGEQVGNHLTSTGDNPLQFATTNTGDGRNRILVCADPPLYAVRYGRDFNLILEGDQILKTVSSISELDGVFVNSAISNTGTIISRQTIMSVLES